MALESLEPRQLLAADVLITEFLASNSGTLLDSDGASPDWIEIHNQGDAPIDLAGWSLTDDATNTAKWKFPTTPLDAGGYLVVFASGKDRAVPGQELHTNFKLSAGGDYVALVSPDAIVVSEFGPNGTNYPPQSTDVSYGLTPDGPGFLATRTPGAPNVAGPVVSAGATQFSVEHGFFNAAFPVELTSDVAGTTFRYTTDGTEPTATHGIDYTGPITIDGTTVLRAAAFRDGAARGKVGTETYLFLDDILKQSPNGETPQGFPSDTVNSQQFDYGLDPTIVNSPVWGPQLKTALTSIPSISLATDPNNLFDASSGIYVNAGGHGRAWERPTSLELINPDGSTGFQINAGVRIRGGFSRGGDNPKHAFRLFFRKEYGDAQLNFPLFGDEGADHFQKVDLRTSQNYSWAFQGDPRNTFVRDVFSRDTQGAMGQPYTRSRFYHLYINGQYWGLYQTQERAEANFGATYFGGKSADYDVVKSAIVPGDRIAAATNGNRDAYDRLYDATIKGFSDNADYLRVQGLNPDGSRNPDYERLLDVDNLIDYMLITYYTADSDGPGSRFTLPSPNNFFAIYNRENPDGFKWFEHDSEHSLGLGRAAGNNMVSPFVTSAAAHFDPANKRYFSPHWLHEKLMENRDYRLRFADRVQKQFFGDGALTQTKVIDRMERRIAQIDTAIIAESARWGDAKKKPAFTKDTWQAAVRRMIQFTNGRVEAVIQQLRDVGWLTEENAPALFISGKETGGPQDVSFDTAGGVVYYTVDGSDPRLPGGKLNPQALAYNRIDGYVDGNSNAKYLIPNDTAETVGWQNTAFDDGGWNSGQSAIGFDTGTPDPTIQIGSGFDVRQVFSDQNVATLPTADAVLAGQNAIGETSVHGVPVINYIDAGDDGHFGDNEAFPGGGGNNFVIQATATLSVNAAGTFTFGINADEAARLRIDGQDVIVDETRHRPQDNFGTLSLSAGQHSVELVMFQLAGGSELELFFARGTYTSFSDAFVPLGRDDGRSLDSFFTTDVQAQMHDQRASAYVRIPFTASDVLQVERLTLQMRYDDGFVAYLNGVEVARRNAPQNVADLDAAASAVHGDFEAMRFEPIDLTEFHNLLHNGNNVLAIEGLNISADDPDFLIVPTLEASVVTHPIELTQSTEVNAREFVAGGAWSVLRNESFVVASPLQITEIHYHPPGPTAAERSVNPNWNGDSFEFIELTNTASWPIDIGGMRFSDGVDFTVPPGAASQLDPGQVVLVVRDREAFQTRYGTGLNVLGQFAAGGLNNGGESLVLVDRLGEVVQSLAYGVTGEWPARADGLGSSLERVDGRPDAGDPASWRASPGYGGSPGAATPAATPPVVINELVTRGGPGQADQIELAGTTGHAIDVSGWWLSDDPQRPDRFVLPAGTTLQPGQPRVFSADQTGIDLDGRLGGTVLLTETTAEGVPLRFVDQVTFDGSLAGGSLGRFPDRDPNGLLFPFPADQVTLGQPNGTPTAGPVILSEIHYRPSDTIAQNFDRGTADGFTVASGAWRVVDGHYQAQPIAAGKDAISTIDTYGPLTNGLTIEATVRLPSSSEFNRNGVIVFDYQSPTDFKFASIHGGGKWRIGARDGDGWHFLAQTNDAVPADTDLAVTVTIDRSLVTLRYKGLKKVSYAFGEPLGTGRAGLATKGGEATFDAVTVRLSAAPDDLEFVELANVSDQPLDLAGWQLGGGVQWTFPSATPLAAGETLVVVGFDPNAPEQADQARWFRQRMGIDPTVRLAGGYAGALSDGGERLALLRPLAPEETGGVAAGTGTSAGAAATGRIVVDQVTYDRQSPWPSVDGHQSLVRLRSHQVGDRPSSWRAAVPDPGQAQFVLAGDTNQDGQINRGDAASFAQALIDPAAYEAAFGLPADVVGDLDADGDIDYDDIAVLNRIIQQQPTPNQAARAVDRIMRDLDATADRRAAKGNR